MPKPPRIHFDGAVYHVVARGVRKTPLFRDDTDFLFFLGLLAIAKLRFGTSILGYCLMTNHIHLVIKVGRIALDRFMHLVMKDYAQQFNRKYGHEGHVFDGPHVPKLVRTDQYFHRLMKYVHDNPVGPIVSRPEDYEWSSFKGIRDRSSALIDFAALEDLTDLDLITEEGTAILKAPTECYIDTSLIFDEPRAMPDLPSLARLVAGARASELSGPARTRDITPLRREFCRRAAAAGAKDAEIARFLNRSAVYVFKARTS